MKIDDIAPDFELPDLDGRLHRLGDYRGGIVIVNFWTSECPHVERTDALITTWRKHWGEDASLLSVASNRSERKQAMAAAAERRGLPLVLVDGQHQVADVYDAQTTPHAFVIDRAGRLRYRGAVDDTYFSRRMPTRFYLYEAVEALRAGKSPPVSDTPPYGCAIIREALE